METGTDTEEGDEEYNLEHKQRNRSYQIYLAKFRQEIQSVIDCIGQENGEIIKFDDNTKTQNIKDRSGYSKEDYSSNNKTDTDLVHVLPVNNTSAKQDNVKAKCHAIWTQFSNKHQKSPSHINNNVQVCEEQYALEVNRNVQKRQTLLLTKKEIQPDVTTDIKKKIRAGFNHTSQDVKESILEKLAHQVVLLIRIFLTFFQIVGIILIAILLLYCLITFHKPTQAFISRHTQDFIYPFMRAIRIISLPFVRLLPILTDFYEESCLFSNPFYAIDDLECWPCENVRHVIDLTGFTNFSSAYHHSGIPFIVKDAFPNELSIDDVRNIYTINKFVLGKAFVETNRLRLTTLEEVFSVKNKDVLENEDFHLEWNINRVTTARIWRKYFPKPYFIPASTEVSVQHFLFIDQISSGTYRLPLTEFANVFLTQASGIRSIVLIPTENCQHQCKVVSAVLQPKDILFYNWLFWRPMSVPADSSMTRSISISYIGSFY